MSTQVLHPDRALIVSSLYTAAEMGDRIGREAYSYRFVYQAFAPLLERWARTTEITQAESRLDYAIHQARGQGQEPIHLSFLPLHLLYLTQHARTVAFPFWEFPDLPNSDFANNPRNNWVRLADRLGLILTACTFTRDAFRRAGVQTPVEVVPVPIRNEYFGVSPWTGGEVKLACPAYVFPEPAPATPAANPWAPVRLGDLPLRARLRSVYKSYIKPRLRPKIDKYLTLAARGIAAMRQARHEDIRVPFAPRPALDLKGIVYTTILNPFDPRKNWQDLLSAFVLALGDRDDATLVVKLVVCPQLAAAALNGMIGYYQGLGVAHRCRVAFVAEYLSAEQMVTLARGSTYYLNTARAEGACLPLQDFLAAGRPGVAPTHTAMADYFDDAIGFPLSASLEPAAWPHDPESRLTTRWHRLDWQALYEQLQQSYRIARDQPGRYQALATKGRARMLEFAHADRVWPRLAAALDRLGSPHRDAGLPLLADGNAAWRKAS